ncbi:thioredoxin [Eubacterium limosum]|uniref:thioredoxin n=1 Tax=Eubacterium limosum TaxID=1736 RepID=UPI0022E57CA4|nr:thioredoxin [Eubacterium limosum]
MARVINTQEFNEEVLKGKGVVLVDFFATWCGPCKALSPILDELAEKVKDAKIVKVDIDADSDLASEYRVMSVPTLKIFKDGEVKESLVGGRPLEELEAKLAEYQS